MFRQNFFDTAFADPLALVWLPAFGTSCIVAEAFERCCHQFFAFGNAQYPDGMARFIPAKNKRSLGSVDIRFFNYETFHFRRHNRDSLKLFLYPKALDTD